jgi:predicted MFS family arabinose efflux permease
MLGPLVAGRTADRLGVGCALRLAFVIQAVAVALPLLTGHAIGLIVSSLIVGAFVPGVVPLAFGRARELSAGDAQRAQSAWSTCTAAFAIGQAAGAYALSAVFALTGGGYRPLFALGAAALLLALAIDWAAAIRARSVA